jgi:AcrR family transcriptional regulator
MARASNKGERRAQIIQGAIEAVAAHGYAGATTRRIAEHAGLSHGLVHYTFADKDALMAATCRALAALIRARYLGRLGESSDPRDQLDAFVHAHTSLDAAGAPAAGPAVAGADAVRCWAALVGEAPRNPALADEVAEWVTSTLDTLTDLYATLGAAAPRACAATVVSAIQGAFQLAVVRDGLLPEGFAYPHVSRVARALAAPAEARR